MHMNFEHYFILLHQKMKATTVQKHPKLYVVLGPLGNISGRPLLLLKIYKMAQVEGVEAQSLVQKGVEEVFKDRDTDVFYTILLNGPIDDVKQKLKLLKDQ